jgi:hypothetical protein
MAAWSRPNKILPLLGDLDYEATIQRVRAGDLEVIFDKITWTLAVSRAGEQVALRNVRSWKDCKVPNTQAISLGYGCRCTPFLASIAVDEARGVLVAHNDYVPFSGMCTDEPDRYEVFRLPASRGYPSVE